MRLKSNHRLNSI